MKTQYQEISDCILDLIETQDFIVIPEFGALIMQLEPSTFSASENVLFPPRKKILFNPLLKHNDGLLVSEIQKKLGIEFVLAQTIVNHFVQSLNTLIETKGRATIEGVGYFYKDTQGNILFESSLNPFYLSESFGLYPIHTIPVEKEQNAASSILPDKTSSVLPNKKIFQLNPKNFYKAAAVFIIAGLMALYWWLSPPELKTNLANVAGIKSSPQIKVKTTKYPDIKVKYDEFVFGRLKKENSIFNNNHLKTSIDNLSNKKINSIFSIVAGCFKVEQNAKKLLNEFRKKGIEASVKWDYQKQLFVVSVGNYHDKDIAVSKLNLLKIKGILKDAWIREEQ